MASFLDIVKMNLTLPSQVQPFCQQKQTMTACLDRLCIVNPSMVDAELN